MRNKDSKISIVIPVYNEAEHIVASVATVRSILTEHHIRHEFVLIDDGSRDNTWEKLSGMAEAEEDVLALRLSRNFGKEAALCAGLDKADGDAVLVMDSDLQHPPQLIPEMVRIWREEGVDVVEGVKSNRGRESALYRACSNFFYKASEKMTGIHFKNASDFKILDRQVIDAWKELPERTTFFRGMSAWVGFERREIAFEVQDRVAGRRKWSLKRLFALAVNSITSYTSLPLQFVTVMGTMLLIFSIVLGIQTIYMKLAGNADNGFTTMILLLLFIGSMIMISLGIIGIYLMKIYNEIKGRPRYIVSKTVKKGKEPLC